MQGEGGRFALLLPFPCVDHALELTCAAAHGLGIASSGNLRRDVLLLGKKKSVQTVPLAWSRGVPGVALAASATQRRNSVRAVGAAPAVSATSTQTSWHGGFGNRCATRGQAGVALVDSAST
jgi:hypothetical protein